jgi:MATE family multidrug resistance protein
LAGSWRPEPARLAALLRLGIPTGASYLIEVTAFTFVSIFVAGLGATVAAGQQVAANLVGVAYMFPLAIANATGVLAAQALGAGDARGARRIARRGVALAVLVGASIGAGLALFPEAVASAYADDPRVIASAAGLIVLIAFYVPFDAVQVTLAFTLRAWRIATLPMVVYAVSLWGVGLGGGWWLTFGAPAWAARSGLVGAQPFWAAAAVSIAIAAAGLGWLLARTLRRSALESGAAPAATQADGASVPPATGAAAADSRPGAMKRPR